MVVVVRVVVRVHVHHVQRHHDVAEVRQHIRLRVDRGLVHDPSFRVGVHRVHVHDLDKDVDRDRR